jgi:hypothetical protein
MKISRDFISSFFGSDRIESDGMDAERFMPESRGDEASHSP